MHEIRHLSCFLYRVIKITVFASATSIHLHKKVQTQVTLQLAVCASWRRFRSTETHETTSVITESDRLCLKTGGPVLEFVKSKFKLHLRNNAVRKNRIKLDSVLKSRLLIMHSRCLFSDPHKTQTHCVGRT